ncbi:MAG: hypothetical protein IKV15_01015 [Bacteroidaceae bacterium]|nr:hypothetical protein [Bacteroidaceae bacterium]
MKPLKYLLLALLLASCAEDKGVYICTGSMSRRYHKKETCKGLDRCSGEILKVSVEEARSYKRTPCRFCYE